MSPRTRVMVGAWLAAVGLAGTLVVGPSFPVPAQQADPATETHQAMDAMMDAMHGPATADRMHQHPGAEEMMEQCASMMASMGGWIMDGGMMDR